jgi:hypothetical protein
MSVFTQASEREHLHSMSMDMAQHGRDILYYNNNVSLITYYLPILLPTLVTLTTTTTTYYIENWMFLLFRNF